MRILTVRQPWAALIAAGAKNVENRRWSTPYRGPVAIHSAATDDGPAWRDPLVRDVLRDLKLHPADQVYGAVLAVVELADVHPSAGLCCVPWGHQEGGVQHLVLDDARALTRPVPLVGKLGLTRLDPAAVDQVLTRLPAAA